jgi:cation diffusion facilitator CzcD-associated flavoprotein CzcO
MRRRPSVIIVGGGWGGGLCAAQALKSTPVDGLPGQNINFGKETERECIEEIG